MIGELAEFYNPVLETERLKLRKITPNDVEDIFAYCSNEEVARYTTWPAHASIDHTKGFVQFILSKYQERQVAPWGMELKSSGKLIGTVGFVDWNHNHARAELGYAMSQDYWNKGLMSEATREIIRYGFEVMKLVRIEARCLMDNTGSARVMEKCGMELEGILRKHALVKGQFQDLKLYSTICPENTNISSSELDEKGNL